MKKVELGYVPLSSTGAELLFETFSQRYERGSTIVTSNLPFEDWTSVMGSERLTGALFDRLTHHVSILAHEWRQLSPETVRHSSPHSVMRGGVKPGHPNRRSKYRRNPHTLIENAAADMEMAPIGAISMSAAQPCRGLLYSATMACFCSAVDKTKCSPRGLGDPSRNMQVSRFA